MSLFANNEKMKSGLIPRFLIMMLQPMHTPFEELIIDSVDEHEDYKDNLKTILEYIHHLHKDRKVIHQLLIKSKTGKLFSQYYGLVIEWTEKHKLKMAYQDAITLVSKSLGQILRLSGILNAFFIEYNAIFIPFYIRSRNLRNICRRSMKFNNVQKF